MTEEEWDHKILLVSLPRRPRKYWSSILPQWFPFIYTIGASNQAPSPVGATYTRQMDHQQQRTVDFLSKMEGASNHARHPVGATFSPSYKFGNYGAGQHER